LASVGWRAGCWPTKSRQSSLERIGAGVFAISEESPYF
jgi:hypothetical protein